MAAEFRIIDPIADERMARSGLRQYWPRVLLYPLRGFSPGVMVAVALLASLGWFGGIMSVLVAATAFSWAIYYGFRVVEHTSLGHALPPALDGGAALLLNGRTLGALVYPTLLLGLSLAGPQVDSRLTGAVLAILAAGWPAHWLILAAGCGLLAALHPAQCIHVVHVLGRTYLVVSAVLLGSMAAVSRLAPMLPVPLAILLGLYLWLAFCHLIGFVAYQHHEQIGLGVNVARPSEESDRRQLFDEDLKMLMQTLTPLAGARNWQGAGERLFKQTGSLHDAREWNEALLERFKDRRWRPLILAQSARLITVLVQRQRLDRALDIVQDALDLDAGFRLESPQQLLPVAERALESRRSELFDRLVTSASVNPLDAEAAADLDLLRVRSLVDFRIDDQKARELIGELVSRPGGHRRAAQLLAYQRALGGTKVF